MYVKGNGEPLKGSKWEEQGQKWVFDGVWKDLQGLQRKHAVEEAGAGIQMRGKDSRSRGHRLELPKGQNIPLPSREGTAFVPTSQRSKQRPSHI